jgi:hypothetical protein
MNKICVVCGKEFYAPPSSKKITCSDDCSLIRKSASHKGKSNTWSNESKQALSKLGKTDNLRKGTPAAIKSPIAGSFETNQNALDWVIKSPSGVVYAPRNLMLWIKNNINLFPGNTVPQVWSGFMQIKRSMTGKRKESVTHYKGWQLISWRDPKKEETK